MRIIYVIYLSFSGNARVPNILVIEDSWKDESALIRLNCKNTDITQNHGLQGI